MVGLSINDVSDFLGRLQGHFLSKNVEYIRCLYRVSPYYVRTGINGQPQEGSCWFSVRVTRKWDTDGKCSRGWLSG